MHKPAIQAVLIRDHEMIEISEKGRQIGEAEVTSLEDEFGSKLPESYRRFLFLQNGGIPSPDVVDVTDAPGSPTDVQVFFGIGRDFESSDLFWNLRLFADRYPGREMLPIACDSGGNLFCLRALKNGTFDVQYCDLDEPDGGLYEVAPDFDSFLNKIRQWEH